MNRIKSLVKLTVILLFLCISPIIFAADLVWLSQSSISTQYFLEAPPKTGSLADKKDIEKVLAYQTSRTETDCKRAQSEMNDTLANLFGLPYGPLGDFEVEKYSPLYAKLHAETKYFVDEMKKQWNRPRPQQADSKVNPCVSTKSLQAYPSGHAAVSLIFAEVLSYLRPEDAKAFKTRADQIAEDRILAGAHRPAGVDAGKKLGAEIVKLLFSNPKFQQELNNLKSEPMRP